MIYVKNLNTEEKLNDEFTEGDYANKTFITSKSKDHQLKIFKTTDALHINSSELSDNMTILKDGAGVLKYDALTGYLPGWFLGYTESGYSAIIAATEDTSITLTGQNFISYTAYKNRTVKDILKISNSKLNYDIDKWESYFNQLTTDKEITIYFGTTPWSASIKDIYKHPTLPEFRLAEIDKDLPDVNDIFVKIVVEFYGILGQQITPEDVISTLSSSNRFITIGVLDAFASLPYKCVRQSCSDIEEVITSIQATNNWYIISNPQSAANMIGLSETVKLGVILLPIAAVATNPQAISKTDNQVPACAFVTEDNDIVFVNCGTQYGITCGNTWNFTYDEE